jgi:hypothetical protein
MKFIKKKTEPKEEPKQATDQHYTELAKNFNSMIEKYGVLNPDQFVDETKVLQHNILFAIYMEIKALRELIEKQ